MNKRTPLIVYLFRIYFNTLGLVFKGLAANQLIRLFSTPRKKVFRKAELELLNKAQEATCVIDDTEIRIYQWGTGERLAMLFHGWESNAGSLGAFIQPLIDKGFRIVSFDAPAHGRSGGKRANLVYFKSIAKQIIEKYGIPELAIGHSLGANSVIMTAYESKLMIPKVVLISPLDYLMTVFDEMKDLLKIPNPLFELFIKKFGEQVAYNLNDFYFHNYAEQTNLKNVLILHDEGDKVTKFFHAKSLNQHWTSAQLVSTNSCGHYRILWSKQSLNATLKFIEN